MNELGNERIIQLFNKVSKLFLLDLQERIFEIDILGTDVEAITHISTINMHEEIRLIL